MLYAPPGYGKSFLCLFLVIMWKNKRVYSNLDFFYKWKKINKTLGSISNIKKIQDSDVPGLVIMDEMGGNANPRRSGSTNNLDIVSELTIYLRKKNCSVIFVAQTDNMFDVYIRKMAFIEFELLQPYLYYEDGMQRLLFRMELKKYGQLLDYVELELFYLLDWGWNFDSSQKSLLETKEASEVKEDQTLVNTVSQSKEELEELLQKTKDIL